MASPFDVFNRPTLALRRITSPTSGNFDSGDVWVPATQATTTFQGHLSLVDRMGRESAWRNGQQGVIEDGSLRLYTETMLQKGDIIEADQEGGKVFRYRVLGMYRALRFMAKVLGTPVRYEFEILEIPE